MNALTLPDIAAQASRQALPLDWVGMCGVALPVLFDGQRLLATADAGVSLDDGSARQAGVSDMRRSATPIPPVPRALPTGDRQAALSAPAVQFPEQSAPCIVTRNTIRSSLADPRILATGGSEREIELVSEGAGPGPSGPLSGS